MQGKLKAETVAKHPMMPWWGAAAAERGAYHYGNIDFVSVAYLTDAEKAAELIPEDLTLIPLPDLPGKSAANLIFAKYRENDKTGPYMETILTVPVLFDGQPFIYVVAIYVDNDAALIAGREFGGYPKKIAKITMHNYGDLFLSRIERSDNQRKTADAQFADLASSQLRKGAKLFEVPLPAEGVEELPFPYNMLLPLPPATGEPQPYILPTIGLRTFPGVGPEAGTAQVQQLIGTPWIITKAEVWAGETPSIDLFATEEDPLAELLPNEGVVGAFILRGDMYTDPGEWLLLKDYKA